MDEVLAEYVEAGRDIRRMTRESVSRLLNLLDLDDAPGTVSRLEELLPALIVQYSDLAAVAAADLYDALRPSSLPSHKRVLAAADVSDLGPSIGWAAEAVYRETPDRDMLQTRLSDTADRVVKNTGQATTVANANADKAKPKWGRIAIGKTCDWCRMLATRGFAYHSAASAGELTKFHSECDCIIKPQW